MPQEKIQRMQNRKLVTTHYLSTVEIKHLHLEENLKFARRKLMKTQHSVPCWQKLSRLRWLLQQLNTEAVGGGAAVLQPCEAVKAAVSTKLSFTWGCRRRRPKWKWIWSKSKTWRRRQPPPLRPCHPPLRAWRPRPRNLQMMVRNFFFCQNVRLVIDLNWRLLLVQENESESDLNLKHGDGGNGLAACHPPIRAWRPRPRNIQLMVKDYFFSVKMYARLMYVHPTGNHFKLKFI